MADSPKPEGVQEAVTVALLGGKIDGLTVLMQSWTLKAEQGQIERHALDNRLARIEERLSMYAVGLTAFTLVASAIAAYIATIVK